MTPRRERPAASHACPPQLGDEDFPELPSAGLGFLPRGRKDRRASWDWSQNGVEDRARSLSKPRARSVTKAETDDEQVEAPRGGRVRTYSVDAGLDALEQDAAKCTQGSQAGPKSALKKKTPVAEDTIPKEMAAMMQAEMAALVKKYQAMSQTQGAEVDVACLLGTTLNQSICQLGNADTENAPVAGKVGKVQMEGEAAAQEEIRPRRHSGTMPVPAGPNGGASWDYPLSCNEKKTRVIYLQAMENDSLADEMESLKS